MNRERQTDGGLEANVIRVLAVVALVAAAIIAGSITINSGIFDRAQADVGADTGTVATVSTDEEPTGETAVETTTTTQNTYEIKPNDSFATIAEQYNTSIARIVELNPNLDPQNLKPGTVINVP